MKEQKAGLWVAIDGIDAVGKTTQVPLVADRLRQIGIFPVETVSEFSTSPIGEAIREILRKKRFYALHPELKTPMADTVALLSDMLFQYETIIAPTIAKRGVAISDRGIISFVGYQSIRLEERTVNFDLEEAMSWTDTLAQHCLITPGLTLLLTIPEEEMVRRIKGRGENIPSGEDLNFLRKSSQAFRQVASIANHETIEINGDRPKDIITQEITSLIVSRLRL